ncbi:3-hydroxyisobutyryl-CoA hydrolase-like protein [Drosera capensis]
MASSSDKYVRGTVHPSCVVVLTLDRLKALNAMNFDFDDVLRFQQIFRRRGQIPTMLIKFRRRFQLRQKAAVSSLPKSLSHHHQQALCFGIQLTVVWNLFIDLIFE